jgi:4,4'-diapophytoene synthase
MMGSKRKDIKQCEDIIKKNSLTFYKAFSKIKDKQKREAVYAVYAFCRYADDLIDEGQDIEGLNMLKENLDQFVSGQIPNDFRFRALFMTTKSFYPETYDYQPFYDMIKGQEMDFDFKEIKTEADLLKYCYHVAGTVGLMLIPILSNEHEQLRTFAINLGYAMQITNILRDIGEDYKKGRIYIPASVLKKANYSVKQLSHGIINSEFIHMFEYLAQKAESFYEQALSDLHMFSDDIKVPLGLAIILYREIIQVCRQADYDVFNKKQFVSDERKEQLVTSFLKSFKRG